VTIKITLLGQRKQVKSVLEATRTVCANFDSSTKAWSGRIRLGHRAPDSLGPSVNN
jgi:hypothetical protein